jgi:hypothetical protein
MNHAIVWRLFWKEFRVQWQFWIAMAVLTALVQLVILATASLADRTPWLFGAALVLTAFYALGCGATLFATEHETGTFDFQRALPVSSRLLFASKTTFGVVSVLAFGGTLWLAAALMAGRPWPSAEELQGLAGLWGFAAVELFAWGLLFSLLLRGPLMAAILAVSAASFLAHIVAGGPATYMAEQAYRVALPLRAAIVIVVVVADLWLGLRWFQQPGLSLGRLRLPRLPAIAASPTAAAPIRPSRVMGLQRLLWQQWRQSGLLMLAIPILAAFWLLPAVNSANGSLLKRASELITMLCTMVTIGFSLLGATVFLADQRRHQFRFFAERGISPRLVWLSRQLSWGVLNLVGAVVFLGVGLFATLSHDDSSARVVIVLCVTAAFLLATAVACSCGQVCSMFLRSGILAGIGAVVLAVPMALWAALMWCYGFNWLWSVLPLPLAFLWATWLRAPDWIVERNRLRTWLWPVLPPVIAAAVLVPTVAYLRVHEFETVSPGFSLEELDQPATKEAKATAALYQRALDLLEPRKRFIKETGTDAPATPEATRQTNAAWLAANPEALRLALDAAGRKECDGSCFSSGRRAVGLPDADDLALLVAVSGEQLESSGDLDGALDRHLAVLRIAQHVRQQSEFPDAAHWIETRLYDQFLRWATRPGQTVARIQQAIWQLDKITATLPSTDRPIKSRYRQVSEELTGGLSVGRIQGRSTSPFTDTLWRLLPWERARALRLLDQLTAIELGRLLDAERAIASGHGVNQGLLAYWQEDPRVQTTPSLLRDSYYPHAPWLNRSLIRTEASRRVLRLQLALAAWKLDHKSLPRSLDELAGRYLDRIPLDPRTGEPFRYFPDGLPIPLPYPDHKSSSDPQLKAGQPFLWAAGELVSVQRDDPDPVERYYIHDYGNAWREPRSEYEVWQAGWVYPVP